MYNPQKWALGHDIITAANHFLHKTKARKLLVKDGSTKADGVEKLADVYI